MRAPCRLSEKELFVPQRSKLAPFFSGVAREAVRGDFNLPEASCGVDRPGAESQTDAGLDPAATTCRSCGLRPVPSPLSLQVLVVR